MITSRNVLAIIPAHNESRSIEKVIRELRSAEPKVDILVVNDASTDDTSKIARSLGVKVAELPFNLGIGGAVQTGFMIARQLNCDFVVQVDADGQHDPTSVTALIEPLLRGEADITIGSRHLLNGTEKTTFMRHIGNRFFSWLASQATSQTITDCSSGFRGLNASAYELFAKTYPVDFPDAEAIIAAHRAGLRIVEVPARFRARDQGRSSLRSWRMLYYPFKEILSIAVMMTRKPRNAP